MVFEAAYDTYQPAGRDQAQGEDHEDRDGGDQAALYNAVQS